MDSWDAPGNSLSKIHVVGYALSVVQRNLPQEELKSPEDALCVGPQLGALPGGPGRRLVLTPLPLPGPTPGGYFVSLGGCCVTLCFQAWLEKCSEKYIVQMNWHSSLPLGRVCWSYQITFLNYYLKKTNPCAIHVIVTEKMGVNQLFSVLKTGSFQFALL